MDYTIEEVLESIANGQRKQAWSQMLDPCTSSAIEPMAVFEELEKEEILRMIRVGLHSKFIEFKNPEWEFSDDR